MLNACFFLIADNSVYNFFMPKFVLTGKFGVLSNLLLEVLGSKNRATFHDTVGNKLLARNCCNMFNRCGQYITKSRDPVKSINVGGKATLYYSLNTGTKKKVPFCSGITA